jgi:hypothetical protein
MCYLHLLRLELQLNNELFTLDKIKIHLIVELFTLRKIKITTKYCVIYST